MFRVGAGTQLLTGAPPSATKTDSADFNSARGDSSSPTPPPLPEPYEIDLSDVRISDSGSLGGRLNSLLMNFEFTAP